jgi:hypothetical protein
MAAERRMGERVTFEHGIGAHMMGIDGTWRRDCTMEDVSETGAKLTIEGSIEGLHLKEFFLLLSSTGLLARTTGTDPLPEGGERAKHDVVVSTVRSTVRGDGTGPDIWAASERVFDAAVATMSGAGRYVPIFNDKGLSYSAEDALAMVGTARRLGIPLVAGSTIPLTWRLPAGTQWPYGEAMTDAVAVGYGEADPIASNATAAGQKQNRRVTITLPKP